MGLQKKLSTPAARMLAISAVGVLAGLIIVAGIGLYLSARIKQAAVNKQADYAAKDLYASAVTQIDKGDYTQAEFYLKQALQKDEGQSTYVSQLAVVEYRLKHYQESVEQYKLLVDQQKDADFAWNGMGNAYRDWAAQDAAHAADHQAKAEAAYREAIATNAHYVASYSNLGLLLRDEGKTADALKLLDQGIAATGSAELSQVKSSIAGASKK